MKKILLLTLAAVGLWGCTKTFVGDQPANNERAVFEELHEQIELKYSYLQYKGLDWDAVYDKYSPQVQNGMGELALFRVLEKMMNELRDGHANLFTPFNFTRYYPVFLNSPENFDSRLLLENYLRRDPDEHFITAAFNHTILDTLGLKVGLITYRSFSMFFTEAHLDFIMERMANVDGIILDMRSNGGGAISNVYAISGRFTDVERISHYNRMKTGPGPDDFGPETTVKVIPSSSDKRFTGRLVMLTNRGSYSATSLFALQMRALPQARIIGDTTGGGLGLPHGAGLSNGWNYRFSVGQALSAEVDANNERYNWEDGVPPHIQVDLDPTLAAQGFDSMVERAIVYIRDGN